MGHEVCHKAWQKCVPCAWASGSLPGQGRAVCDAAPLTRHSTARPGRMIAARGPAEALAEFGDWKRRWNEVCTDCRHKPVQSQGVSTEEELPGQRGENRSTVICHGVAFSSDNTFLILHFKVNFRNRN